MRALPLLALILVLPLAAAQEALIVPTGDLYLAGDGSLATTAPDSPSACLTLSGPNAAADSKTFARDLAEGAYAPLGGAVTLVVALAGQNGASQSGSGFALQGTLAFGTSTPIEAAPAQFGPAQSPSSATLTFPLEGAAETMGPLNLTLTLTPVGGPLPATLGQDVSVVCGHSDSRIASFNLQAPRPLVGGEEGEEVHEPLPLPLVIAIALAAGGATLLAGALAVAGRTISERRLHLLLGATAGLLLAIALLDLIPEAIELNENAMVTIALGVLALFAVKWASGHSHAAQDHQHGGLPHEHVHSPGHGSRLAFIAFFALSFHRFVDGLVLPAAFEVGSATGLAAAGAVLVHQFPDGLAAATVFLAAGWARRRVLAGVAVMAALTPVGAFVGLLFAGISGYLGHLIALAAATFIFIALAELIPELGNGKHRFTVALGFGLGYLAAFGIEYVAGLAGAH